MTRKKTLILVVVVVAAFVVGTEMRYPSSWDQVRVGMTQAEVYELTGRPAYSWGEIKGDFFVKSGLLGTHEMNVYFDKGRASSVLLERRLGTNRTFYRTVLRSE